MLKEFLSFIYCGFHFDICIFTKYLLVGFDEYAQADQLFAWHIIQIEDYKFRYFKKFILQRDTVLQILVFYI